MKIGEVSEEEKLIQINRMKLVFGHLKRQLSALEEDMLSKDLTEQASAIWVSGKLCEWWDDFMGQIKKIHLAKSNVQDEMEEMDTEKKSVIYHG